MVQKHIDDIERALRNAQMLQSSDPSDPNVLVIIPRSQAAEILSEPVPSNHGRGVADIGKTPAAGIEAPSDIVFFNAEAITDTNNHRPPSGAVMDLRGARNWSFEIQNDHDQAVTIEIIGGSNRSPDAMGLLGVSVAIAANTVEPIATDIFLPFMSLQASYAVGPGSGTLTATGARQLFSR